MEDDAARKGGPLADAIWDVCKEFCPMVAPAGVALPKWKSLERGAWKKVSIVKGHLLGGYAVPNSNVDVEDIDLRRYTFLRHLSQNEHTGLRRKWKDIAVGGDEWHKEIRLFVLGVQASVRGVAPPFSCTTWASNTRMKRDTIFLDKHLCARCGDFGWTFRHQHGCMTDVFELVSRQDCEVLSLDLSESWSSRDKRFRTHLHSVSPDWMSTLDFGFVAYCTNELAEQEVLHAERNDVKSQRRTSPGTVVISPFLPTPQGFVQKKSSVQGQAETCSRLVYQAIQGNDYFATAFKVYASVVADADCVGGTNFVPTLPAWLQDAMRPSVDPLVTVTGEKSVPWADGLLDRWVVAALRLSVLSSVRHLLHLSFIGAVLDSDHPLCPVPGEALQAADPVEFVERIIRPYNGSDHHPWGFDLGPYSGCWRGALQECMRCLSGDDKIDVGGGREVLFFGFVIRQCWNSLREYVRGVGLEGVYDREILDTVLDRGVRRNASADVKNLKMSVPPKWLLHDPCGFHAFYLFACSVDGRDAMAIKEIYGERRMSTNVDYEMTIGDRLVDLVSILLVTYAQTVNEKRGKPIHASKLEASRTIMTRLFRQGFQIGHWNGYEGEIDECLKLRRPAALSNFVYSSHPESQKVEPRADNVAVPAMIERLAVLFVEDDAFWIDGSANDVNVESVHPVPSDDMAAAMSHDSNSTISDCFSTKAIDVDNGAQIFGDPIIPISSEEAEGVAASVPSLPIPHSASTTPELPPTPPIPLVPLQPDVGDSSLLPRGLPIPRNPMSYSAEPLRSSHRPVLHDKPVSDPASKDTSSADPISTVTAQHASSSRDPTCRRPLTNVEVDERERIKRRRRQIESFTRPVADHAEKPVGAATLFVRQKIESITRPVLDHSEEPAGSATRFVTRLSDYFTDCLFSETTGFQGRAMEGNTTLGVIPGRFCEHKDVLGIVHNWPDCDSSASNAFSMALHNFDASFPFLNECESGRRRLGNWEGDGPVCPTHFRSEYVYAMYQFSLSAIELNSLFRGGNTECADYMEKNGRIAPNTVLADIDGVYSRVTVISPRSLNRVPAHERFQDDVRKPWLRRKELVDIEFEVVSACMHPEVPSRNRGSTREYDCFCANNAKEHDFVQLRLDRRGSMVKCKAGLTLSPTFGKALWVHSKRGETHTLPGFVVRRRHRDQLLLTVRVFMERELSDNLSIYAADESDSYVMHVSFIASGRHTFQHLSALCSLANSTVRGKSGNPNSLFAAIAQTPESLDLQHTHRSELPRLRFKLAQVVEDICRRRGVDLHQQKVVTEFIQVSIGAKEGPVIPCLLQGGAGTGKSLVLSVVMEVVTKLQEAGATKTPVVVCSVPSNAGCLAIASKLDNAGIRVIVVSKSRFIREEVKKKLCRFFPSELGSCTESKLPSPWRLESRQPRCIWEHNWHNAKIRLRDRLDTLARSEAKLRSLTKDSEDEEECDELSMARNNREIARLKSVIRRYESEIVTAKASGTRATYDICDVVVGTPQGLAGCDNLKISGTRQACLVVSDESDQADRLAHELVYDLPCVGSNVPVLLGCDPDQLKGQSLVRTIPLPQQAAVGFQSRLMSLHQGVLVDDGKLPSLRKFKPICHWQLLRNYRSVSEITEIYSEVMFGGRMQSSNFPSQKREYSPAEFTVLQNVAYVDCAGAADCVKSPIRPDSTSSTNEGQIRRCFDFIEILLLNFPSLMCTTDKTLSVAIISNHSGALEQALDMSMRQKWCKYIDLRLGTTDLFQGTEHDVVLLATVVSGTVPRNANTEFSGSISRGNVATTRAVYCMVIFGDSDYHRGVSECFWRQYIRACEKRRNIWTVKEFDGMIERGRSGEAVQWFRRNFNRPKH